MLRRGDGVNQQGVVVRRGNIWLSETDTDPNRRTENFGGVTFSVVLTRTGCRVGTGVFAS
jgi:hypothetical protein